MFLQTPTPEPNILQQIDWRVAIPIITFILGSMVTLIVTFVTFIFAFLKDYLDRRREIKNIKSILYKELKENYKYLNWAIPNEEADPNPEIGSFFLNYLSTSVFDSYLNRLGSLDSELLDELIDTNQSIKAMLDVAEFLRQYTTGGISAKYKIKLFKDQLNSSMFMAYEQARCALNQFEGGREYIEKVEPMRGSLYRD